MPRFIERLTKLEQRHRPAPGELPVVLVVPSTEPDRAQALADVERRRALGQNVIAIGEQEDPLGALVEVFAP